MSACLFSYYIVELISEVVILSKGLTALTGEYQAKDKI